jgi:hypothetical protein
VCLQWYSELRDGYNLVCFEVPTTVTMMCTILLDVMPCCLVEVYQHFRGICCFHLQDQWVRKESWRSLYSAGSLVYTFTQEMEVVMFLWNVSKLLPHYRNSLPSLRLSLYQMPLYVPAASIFYVSYNPLNISVF